MKRQILCILTLLNCSLLMAQWTQFGEDFKGIPNLGGRFGYSVTLSEDGNTMAIGAFDDGDVDFSGFFPSSDNSGKVRIYSKNSDNNWSEIGEIIGKNANEESGRSISLSSDGKTIAIGAPGDCQNTVLTSNGIARVYSINESGDWIQIGNDIVSSNDNDCFGSSVSLSEDGSKVAIGAFNTDKGSSYIYENTNGNWGEIAQFHGEESGNKFGSSLNLSSDGSIVIIGSPEYNNGQGTVKVYNEGINGVWQQIGSNIDGEIVVTEVINEEGETLFEESMENFGSAVGISSDGSIIAIGAPGYNGNDGAVRIFSNVNTVWTEGIQINGVESSGTKFGGRLSLSADGKTIAISALDFYEGLVRVYKEGESNIWTKIGDDIADSSGDDFFGNALALSKDGAVLAIGAFGFYDAFYNDGIAKTYEFTEDDTQLSISENVIENLTYFIVNNSVQVSNDSISVAAVYDITGKNVNNHNLNGIYIVVFEEENTGKKQAVKLYVN